MLAKRLFQLHSIAIWCGYNLAQLRELQWLEYLESVFLEIPNVRTWLVFKIKSHLAMWFCPGLHCDIDREVH